jgi:hypothetical protein
MRCLLRTFANLNGDGNYVRVQVLTNVGALDRDKQVPGLELLFVTPVGGGAATVQ